MKTKGLGLALAAGLFVVALWIALHPTSPLAPEKESPPANRVVDVRPDAVQKPPPIPGQPTAPKPFTPSPSTASRAVSPNAEVPPVSPVPNSSDEPPAAHNGIIPTRDAQIDGNKVHLMLRDFHTLMGENPVGTNAEIMQAVMGGNPKQATLGPPEGMSLNGNGELMDQWGTPYFFHQLSKDLMEIHSAGPDKVMGTPDDVVIR